MTTHTVRVSQRVFYDIEVPAPTMADALAIVHDAMNGIGLATLNGCGMLEVDSGPFEIEAVQTDKDGSPITDEETLAVLHRLTQDKGE